jgi:hypothetical protein
MGLCCEARSGGNKKERVPGGAHSQNLSLSSPTRSYENSFEADIGERKRESNRNPGWDGATIVLASLLAVASPASAASGGVFADLAGAWSGDGSVHLTDGSTSPLRCQANYAISGGGDHLDQTLDCTGQSQRFSFRIQLDSTNGSLLGAWQEVTRQVQGGVVGAGGGGKFELTARGQGFSAQASIVAHGGRQSVAIRAGGGGFTSVSIVLHRGR